MPRTLPVFTFTPSFPTVEARRLANGLAYVAVNTFNDANVVRQFDCAIDELLNAPGLILDLRRNSGGNGSFAREVAARLVDRPLQFERARMRQSVSGLVTLVSEFEPDIHQPRSRPYPGSLAILIGPMTASAAEDFLVGLDSAGRGTLIGQPTNGSTGQPLAVPLPGGGVVRICTRRCLYPDGREFVGRGIPPHVAIAPTIAGLRAGRDEALDAACTWLLARSDVPSRQQV